MTRSFVAASLLLAHAGTLVASGLIVTSRLDIA
jgi:hypothetical protein